MNADLRARIDEYKDKNFANWLSTEARFSHVPIVKELAPEEAGPAPEEAPKRPEYPMRSPAISEHVNRRTYGEDVCIYCSARYVKVSQIQLICGSQECLRRRNTDLQRAFVERQRAMRDKCQHTKGWHPQAMQGRFARYERCRQCGKQRTIGQKISTGPKRSTPAHDPATCPHNPEWRVTVKKNGIDCQRCKACRSTRVNFG